MPNYINPYISKLVRTPPALISRISRTKVFSELTSPEQSHYTLTLLIKVKLNKDGELFAEMAFLMIRRYKAI